MLWALWGAHSIPSVFLHPSASTLPHCSPARPTKHLPFKKCSFCFLASGPWHILFSQSPSLGYILLKVLTWLWRLLAAPTLAREPKFLAGFPGSTQITQHIYSHALPLSLPPSQGRAGLYLKCITPQVHSQSMEETSWKSPELSLSLDCGNSPGQVREQRVPSMEYHVSSGESKDCLDLLKRTKPLALSVC